MQAKLNRPVNISRMRDLVKTLGRRILSGSQQRAVGMLNLARSEGPARPANAKGFLAGADKRESRASAGAVKATNPKIH